METVAPFKEVTEEIKDAGGETFRLCFQCGLCDAVCPWNRVRPFSMRKIIREAAFGLSEIDGEDIWRCSTCGRCPERCPRGVDQIELGISLRRVASEYEIFPASVKSARTARASLISEGNPLQGDREKRGDWAKELPVKPFEEGMDILYFVGCYLSYDPRMKRVAAATARVLDKAGVGFGILGEKESCCGESIRKTGGEDAFKKLARDNIKAFIDHGVQRILVSSPHCFHTFKNEYPEFKAAFDVVHISQYLLELIREGRLELSGSYEKKVAYHDPCYLGRHNGVYDEPREILKKAPGLELVEMADFGADSLCCGGGGGRIWMDTPMAERFSDIRLKQARDAGARELVTCCPYCVTNFEESRLNLEYDDVLEIKDIAEIVSEII
ncbi:Tungsten-dependent benzoyl-CoA reductase-related protein bamD [Candidatus Desulfarcum epimagneticum]|uniref:Tungsten-dependent benzoyl-CoA reductase-related protein bamD n=1 Tax=uncultured Desulfobacteraceae bacterium TaxID=218296 RepID=A0A484HEA8_9BACT|nr:Tungsten-dependent benzoyl-CoA reductase-related protein bamD [uncultured Desulfobacteraceae bacterium]